MFKHNSKKFIWSQKCPLITVFQNNMSTSNSKYKSVYDLLMLIHKPEIHKGAVRNFLSFIYILPISG